MLPTFAHVCNNILFYIPKLKQNSNYATCEEHAIYASLYVPLASVVYQNDHYFYFLSTDTTNIAKDTDNLNQNFTTLLWFERTGNITNKGCPLMARRPDININA